MVLSDTTLRAKNQDIVLYDKQGFTYLPEESRIMRDVYTPPENTRPLMDLLFKENATGKKWQLVNVHLPGDPNGPGREDFARYTERDSKIERETEKLISSSVSSVLSVVEILSQAF